MNRAVRGVAWGALLGAIGRTHIPGREGAHGRLVGVVADRHVLENPRCAHVRPLGQQPQPDAQPGGWGIHHAGQLAAAGLINLYQISLWIALVGTTLLVVAFALQRRAQRSAARL